MSFGNGNISDIYSDSGSAIGNAVADYMNNGDTNYGSIGSVVNDYIMDNPSRGSQVSDAINRYIGDTDVENTLSGSGGSIIPDKLNGNWFNTLGRLGTGILGALGDYQSNKEQQAYIPYTQWLGNGLAKFNVINNLSNKENQRNKAYGNTLMLSSLFGPGKSLLGALGGQIGKNYSDKYNNTTGYDGNIMSQKPIYNSTGIDWKNNGDIMY